MHNTRGVGAVIVACGLLFGCGGAEGPKLAPVEGVVNYKGSPVANANVTFIPENGPIAIGSTDAAGKFTLATTGQAGAPVGSGTVTVVAVGNSGAASPAAGTDPAAMQEAYKKGMMGGAAKSTLPVKYGRPDLSDLKFTVKAGETNKFTIELKD